jgi:hypothetical protein
LELIRRAEKARQVRPYRGRVGWSR